MATVLRWRLYLASWLAWGVICAIACGEAPAPPSVLPQARSTVPTPESRRETKPADAGLFPEELVRFTPYCKNPVFVAGGAGVWDEKIRERGWILKESDGYRMWYTGYRELPAEAPGGPPRRGQMKLGLATSPDGIVWTRSDRNPIYDEQWVEDMQVIQHDGRYLMFAEGKNDRAQLLTSPDGVRWTRVGALDVRRTNGEPIAEGPYGTPTAWWENGTWHLFYERRDAGVWLATSKDLQTFRNVQDEPVLSPGPGEYDRDFVAMNQIVRRGDRYYAYYHGAAKGVAAGGGETAPRSLWSTAIATSTDLVHWTKYSGNPLQPIEENKSSGILVENGTELRLYTMHGKVDLHLPGPPDGKQRAVNGR